MSKRLRREDMPDQLTLPSSLPKPTSNAASKSAQNPVLVPASNSASTASAVMDRDPAEASNASNLASSVKSSATRPSRKPPVTDHLNHSASDPGLHNAASTSAPTRARKTRPIHPQANATHFNAIHPDEDGGNRQAELFYLQKQIQQQTPMVFILEDGSRIQGIIEWYDRNSIKVRGKSRVLIYKSSIKYLYKAGEVGSAPDKI